jgi:sulfur carrier protein ThiS
METANIGHNIGHNSANAVVEIEVRMFNSIARFSNGNGSRFRLALEPGATVGDVLSSLGIPPGEVFLVMVNGRDITPGTLGKAVRTGYELDDGDVLALSGPVPFSWGYGLPVV